MGSGSSLNADSVHTSGKYTPSEETKQAARLTVCHWSEDSREATEFMKMLGIHPSQTSEEFADPLDAVPHTPPRTTWT
jgi:hypothetical protein